MNDIVIQIPDYIRSILSVLEENGFEAQAVGGCVRDSILHKEPDDWDVCTSALPQETANCFEGFRVVPTGIKHGTVTVITDKPVEITTYRIDGEYLDHRRPENVVFTSSLEEDLSRRDFTVNAMAVDMNGNIFDPFGGRNDIAQKVIRTVGEPSKRFEEDALRIMRALRFSSVLGFEIEEKTSCAVHDMRNLLSNVSAERIISETRKFIMGKCEKLLLDYSDVVSASLPEVDTVSDVTVKKIVAAHSLPVKLAFLFGDDAEEKMKRMRFDLKTCRIAGVASADHGEIKPERPALRRLINRCGEYTSYALEYACADGQISEKDHESCKDMAESIIADGDCCTLSALAVNGRDIQSLGLFYGKDIGKTLHRLLEDVMDGKVNNDRSELLLAAEKLRL